MCENDRSPNQASSNFCIHGLSTCERPRRVRIPAKDEVLQEMPGFVTLSWTPRSLLVVPTTKCVVCRQLALFATRILHPRWLSCQNCVSFDTTSRAIRWRLMRISGCLLDHEFVHRSSQIKHHRFRKKKKHLWYGDLSCHVLPKIILCEASTFDHLTHTVLAVVAEYMCHQPDMTPSPTSKFRSQPTWRQLM